MPGKNKKLGRSKENNPTPPTNDQRVAVNWQAYRRRAQHEARVEERAQFGHGVVWTRDEPPRVNNHYDCRRLPVVNKTPQCNQELNLSGLSDTLLYEDEDEPAPRLNRCGYDEYLYGYDYDPDAPGVYNPYAIYEATGSPIPPPPGFGGLTRFYGPFKAHVEPKYTHTWYYPYSMFHAGAYALYNVDQLLKSGRERCAQHKTERHPNDYWVGGAVKTQRLYAAPGEHTRWCKYGQHHVPWTRGIGRAKSQIVKVGSFVRHQPVTCPLYWPWPETTESPGHFYVPAPPCHDFMCVDCSHAIFWDSYYEHSPSPYGAPAEFVEPEYMATVKLPMNLIVAMDDNLGIGKNGDIPWRLSGDLKRFRHLTTATASRLKQNAVLMGRRVWESIPLQHRPLKDRFNVVLSTTMSQCKDGSFVVARSFPEALQLLNSMSDRIETIWNIGGYRLYEEGLRCEQLNQLALTYVEGNFAADVRFPPVEMHNFHKVENGEDNYGTVESGYRYRFETFQSIFWTG